VFQANKTPCHANDQNIPRLLLDAIEGNQMNFIRKDSVEHSWAIIDSLKDSINGQAPEQYPAHSRGPESSRIYG
jgi:glucose-6-phosphate 1-dehydrogenase